MQVVIMVAVMASLDGLFACWEHLLAFIFMSNVFAGLTCANEATRLGKNCGRMGVGRSGEHLSAGA